MALWGQVRCVPAPGPRLSASTGPARGPLLLCGKCCGVFNTQRRCLVPTLSLLWDSCSAAASTEEWVCHWNAQLCPGVPLTPPLLPQ